MTSERIVRLRNGQDAPKGWEIVRLLAQEQVPVGTGTNTETVYVAVVRKKS